MYIQKSPTVESKALTTIELVYVSWPLERIAGIADGPNVS